MALIFQVRGTQLNAWYASGFKDWGTPSTGTPSVVADAASGVFGGSKIALNGTPICYTGLANLPQTGAFTLLMRIVPNFTGNPGAEQRLMNWGPSDGGQASGGLVTINTNSTVQVLLRNNNAGVICNADTSGTVSATSGTPFDLVVTSTGDNGAGQIKVYFANNGDNLAEIGSLTHSGTLSSRTFANLGTMTLGRDAFGTAASYWLNELVWWNEVITVSSLDARSAFVSASELEGYSYSDPGEDNVRNATAYTHAGVAKTGNMTIPPADKVEDGYQYGTSGTELTGTMPIALTSSEVAQAVWNAALSSHTTAGSFGVHIKKLLSVAKFLGLK